MKKTNITGIFRIFGNMLMLASLIFIIRSIAASSVKWADFFRLQTFFAVPCLATVLAAGIYIMALAWKVILEAVSGNKQSFLEIASVYTRSNLGKYLPGNVMHMVMRNTMGKSIKANQGEMALSTLFEMCLVALTGFMFAAILSWRNLANIIEKHQGASQLFIILGVVGVIVLAVCSIVWKTAILSRIRTIRVKDIIRVFSTCLISYGFTISLLGMVMVVNLSFQVSLSMPDVTKTFSAYVISWLIGLIVIGAPGGLGVREATFLFLMNGVCDQEVILSAAVINRVTTTLGDLVAAGGGVIIKRHLVKRSTPANEIE